jgi:hypothetical protein
LDGFGLKLPDRRQGCRIEAEQWLGCDAG